MTDSKEAIARIAVAEIEARRSRESLDMRARRLRFAATLFRILLALGAGVYLQTRDWQISGAQACGLFLIFVASSIWGEHQRREAIRSLETELERLKRELDQRSNQESRSNRQR